MNRTGPGPQPLRSMQGGMFPSQPSNTNRGGQLGAGRLQNGGKLGSGSSWAFGGGIPLGGAPGLSGGQARTNNTGMSSYSQTIGGSQNHTPLDPSEFPSLSNAPQAQQQHNNLSQTLWGANANIRAAQHTPVQRPPGHETSSQHSPAQSAPQSQGQRPQQSQQDDTSSAQPQYGGGVDDYRFGGQGGVGQLSSGASQPQTGNIEEFPPLGGGVGEHIGPDRRASMLQNAAYGSGANGNAFGGSLAQGRNGVSSPTDGQGDQSIPSAIGDRAFRGNISRNEGVRAQLEGLRGNQQGQESDDLGNQRPLRNLGNQPFGVGAQPGSMGGRSGEALFPGLLQQPIGPPSSQSQGEQQTFDTDLNNDHPDTTALQSERKKRLSQMTAEERFGLQGLLAVLPQDSLDHSQLAVGQDLTQLGLDLNNSSTDPLWPTFGSPFADGAVRPMVPRFSLPTAYTVNNVPPVSSRISAFADDTLFVIFYQNPGDLLQEVAATELYNRDWRWNTDLRQWMRKDMSTGVQPQQINANTERGFYIFFDATNWRQEKREFVLSYDSLEQRNPNAPGIASLS